MKQFSPLDNVTVYDNVLSLHEQQTMFLLCQSSNFSIAGWRDLTNSTETYTHSNWSKEDLETSKFLDSSTLQKITSDNGISMDRFVGVLLM
jgi:hypothetical protein